MPFVTESEFETYSWQRLADVLRTILFMFFPMVLPPHQLRIVVSLPVRTCSSFKLMMHVPQCLGVSILTLGTPICPSTKNANIRAQTANAPSLPQTYMFAEMRSALSITKSTDILDHVYTLPPASQEEAFAKIRAIESQACASQEPQPGLLDLMTYLDSKKLPKGICTRNFDGPVAHLLGKFLPGIEISPVVTRDFRPPKPNPAGVLHNAKSWGFVKDDGVGDASHLIMVGYIPLPYFPTSPSFLTTHPAIQSTT